MEDANRVRDIYKAENVRLESVDAVKGAQFAANSEQVKLMQTERIQLLQQIESEKGQKELANQTMMDQKQMILDLHQQIADLRRRQGFLTLQEEKKAALDLAEAERQSAERLQQELNESQAIAAETQASLEASQHDLQAARGAAADLMQRLDTERLQKANLEAAVQAVQDQNTALEARAEDAEARLASTLMSIQEAATRKAASPPAIDARTSSDTAKTNGKHDYFDAKTNGQMSDKAIVEEPGSFPSHPGSQAASPRSPPYSPYSPILSPSEGGFRTIHGQHRPDGSLGGYRAGKGMRRVGSSGVARTLNSPVLGGANGNGRRSESVASTGSNSNSRGSVGGSVQTPREDDEDLYGP